MENIVKMKYDMTALVVIDQTFVLALRYDLPSWLSIYYYHYYILFNLGVFFFCFVFLVEKQDPRISIIAARKNYKESRVTEGAISAGEEPIHTCSSLPETAFVAKKWATVLSICLT